MAETPTPGERQRIVHVTRWPMNPEVLLVTLACGHEMNMVQKARPAMYARSGLPRNVPCPTCRANAEGR